MPGGGPPGYPGGPMPGGPPIPGGGPPRPIMPGGGPIPGGPPIPGGGPPRPMPGGGPPMPGGGPIPGGAPRPAWFIWGGAPMPPRPIGAMMFAPGPPTPRAGPARPAGAAPMAATGRPRPAGAAWPGPVAPAPSLFFGSAGGLLSTVMDTTQSPRNTMSPSARFSSLSSPVFPPDALFTGRRLNSSASPRTTFMCLSNAMNLPTNCLPSSAVTRIL